MSTLAGHSHVSRPVVRAGLSFLAVAVCLITGAYLLHSGVVASLGIETLFDGLIYVAGGFLSERLARSSWHSLFCTARQSLELAVLGAGLVFLTAALFQPSSETGWRQAALGAAAAGLATGLTLYWHPRIDEHDDHKGFDWHLRADMVIAAAAAIGSIGAWIRAEPSWNFWSAVVGALVAIGMSVKPMVQLLSGMLHHALNHPTSPSSPHYHHH